MSEQHSLKSDSFIFDIIVVHVNVVLNDAKYRYRSVTEDLILCLGEKSKGLRVRRECRKLLTVATMFACIVLEQRWDQVCAC